LRTRAKKNSELEDFLTREEFRARFDAEKISLQRHYCTLFEFWRSCRGKSCRRARACAGDAAACLRRSVGRIARHRQFVARQQLLRASPKNLAAPESAARAIMPNSFDDRWGAFRARDIPAGWTRAARRRKT
jgi:hypothetical protein